MISPTAKPFGANRGRRPCSIMAAVRLGDGEIIPAIITVQRNNLLSFELRTIVQGNGRVELSQEFRANSAQCLTLSKDANSIEAQGYWVAMAQFWFQLAQHAEE